MNHSEIAVESSTLSGFVIMFHSYYYISLFVTFVNISVSLSSLLQRIASIYNRFYLPRFDKLFKENYIFSSIWGYPKYYFLAACY